MTTDGFLADRRTSPTSLAVVIALHAVVLGAVIVAKGPRVLEPPPIFRLIEVPPETVPDPLPPPPPQKHQARPDPRPTTVPPTIPTNTVDLTALTARPPVDPFPALPTLPPGPAADPLPPPAPVVTEAALDPRFADALQPPYPPALARADIEGKVTVRVLIGTDGRVADVQLVSADDPGFFAATAKQARRAWRFRPATRDGVPVTSWRTMTVRFTLRA